MNTQACDDAARKTAAATDDKPARSWAKHTTRRTYTSYRLTLELSGGAAVRLERIVSRHLAEGVWKWTVLYQRSRTWTRLCGRILPE